METFNVHITFSNGDSFVERDKDIEAVRSAIIRLTRGPAAAAGLIREVRVIDTGDCIVFHARDGKILWPKERASA